MERIIDMLRNKVRGFGIAAVTASMIFSAGFGTVNEFSLLADSTVLADSERSATVLAEFKDPIFRREVIKALNKLGRAQVPQNSDEILADAGLDENYTDPIFSTDKAKLKEIKTINYNGSNKDYGEKVKSADGLQYLTGLQSLELHHNLIEEIDLSGNKSLTLLGLNGNNIEEIDLSENTELNWLSLNKNKLEYIDISGNTLLKRVEINNNKLKAIELPSKRAMEQVYEKELSTGMDFIDLESNQIEELDLSIYKNLRGMDVYDNKLIKIDLSSNKKVFFYGARVSPQSRSAEVDDPRTFNMKAFLGDEWEDIIPKSVKAIEGDEGSVSYDSELGVVTLDGTKVFTYEIKTGYIKNGVNAPMTVKVTLIGEPPAEDDETDDDSGSGSGDDSSDDDSGLDDDSGEGTGDSGGDSGDDSGDSSQDSGSDGSGSSSSGSSGNISSEEDIIEEPEINEVKTDIKYMHGYEDKTFRPEGDFTRAEAAAVYSRLLENGDENVNSSIETDYSDTKDGWYERYINYMTEKGLMDGYPDGSFKPNQALTRAELAKIVAESLRDYEGDTSEGTPFKDIDNHWGEGYIAKLYFKEIISGNGDGKYRPEDNVTRAEAAKIFNIFFERGIDSEGLEGLSNPENIEKFPDLSENHWGYYEIMEAANSHKYHEQKDTRMEKWIEIIE